MIEGLQEILKADSARSTKVDCNHAVEEYINKSDWRISANSNTSYSSAGLVNNLAGKIIANYWLDKVYSKKEGDAHRSGDYHIHDLDCLQAYCFTKDTRIKTIEYGDVTIAWLLERGITSYTVVSFDDVDYKKVSKRAFNLALTRENAELVEVEFIDGLKVRCTPDHKFLVAYADMDKSSFRPFIKFEWVEAKDIMPGRMSSVKSDDTFSAFNQLIKNDSLDIEQLETLNALTGSSVNDMGNLIVNVTHLEETEDVYCMTVEDTHCFCLENGSVVHNCCGHDLQVLLNEGFNGVIGRVGSKPPKHFREALYQMANFIGILQAEWAGAQAFSSFDTYLAPYLFFDMKFGGMTKDDAKKAIRNFVYNLNVPSRWGQSPFSNITIDWYVPKTLKEVGPTRNSQPYFMNAFEEMFGENWLEMAHTDKRMIDFIDELRKRLNMGADMDDEDVLYSVTYSLFQEEMDIINECYYSVMNEGDKDGNPFTFPIPTVNIDEDFDWNHPNVNILFENTARYGTSYFQNFIGSQYKRNENGELVRDENAYSPADIRSMCPLAINTRVMTNHGNKRIDELDTEHDLVFTGKNWTRFELSPVYHNHRLFIVTFENGATVYFSALHVQPIHGGGTKFAQDLCLDDVCDFYIDGKITQSKVIRIEKGKIEETLCLETKCESHQFVLANGLITSNCRLQLDKTLLRKRGGGLFGSDAQTGSIGVVTINLARLGYLFKGDLKGLYKRLDQLMDLAKSTLEKKRVFVKEMNARGLYPYTRRYLKTYDTYFSTIGVNGGNEMVRNFTNDEYDITDPRGQKMAMDLLTHIRERLLKYQDETGNLYNLEATPAEGCLEFGTEILTIEGPKKIGELVENDIDIPLLSYNKETKKLEYKNSKIFFDSITEKIYKITFDNGLSIECTSEHPFAVRFWNGRKGEDMYWSPASALKVGDRIKSVYPRLSLHGYKKYGKDFFEHRGVYSYYKGEIPEGCVIHHKNGDKMDNSYENLELMTESEHKSHHIKDMFDTGVLSKSLYGEDNPFYGKSHSDETKFNIAETKCTLTDEQKDAIIEAYTVGLEYKQISRLFNMSTQPMDYIRRMKLENRPMCRYPKFNKNAITYLYKKGYSDEEIVDILRGHNTLDKVRDVILELNGENHKIVSIEILNKNIPVYNASVEDNQNFFVGNEELGYVLTHNTTYRFAREDQKKYGDKILQAGTPDAPYYTNSTQLPVYFTDDIFTALDLQDDLQKAYTGGTVLHIYTDEEISAEECKTLIKKVISNYRLPYVSFTATFSTCPKHGRIPGVHEYCPLCDKELMEEHIKEIDLNKE